MSKAKFPQLLCTRTGLIQMASKLHSPCVQDALTLGVSHSVAVAWEMKKKWERVDQQSDALEGGVN